jgi:protease-4
VTLVLVVASVGLAGPAGAQRFAEEPTSATELPATPLAGDHDALSVSVNPAGLVFLPSWHLELAYTRLAESTAEGPGSGFGLYGAAPLKVPLLPLPELAFGFGIEQLAPPRVSLAPDPGAPVRLSLAMAYMWRHDLALGLAWRLYEDEGGGVLDGKMTLDAGLSWRLGPHLAFGAVVHDATTPVVGGSPVQRRWQGELVLRPTGTDAFELGAGVTFGERRHEFDPALRLGFRLARGLWIRGAAALESRWLLEDPALPGGRATQEYGVRASLGLEVSFGTVGAAAFVTAGDGAEHGSSVLGGSGVIRYSGERLPTVVPERGHMERLDLTGALDERQLTNVLLTLRRMERDDDVKALFVKIDGLELGWADLEDLRDALHRLRARHKKVVAYLIAATTRDYYVAVAADAVLQDAAGGIRLQGLLGLVLYYKGLFEKLGIVAQFEKIEEWKSAPEAFTLEGPSEPAKQMRDAIFDDIYGRLAVAIAEDRRLSADEVKKLIDQGPFTAAEAASAKLVDAVVEPEGLEDALAKALGGRLIPFGSMPAAARASSWGYPKIAIIYVDGDIVDGKSKRVPLWGSELVGGETIAESIAWAREQDDIVAIVLRVNSPGGSALASEMMAREMKAARGVKPIIVSMGDVAASGGYFCSAYGDKIYAQPSTITGSIGIFTGKVDVTGMLVKLGVNWDLTERGTHAGMDSFYRPYSDDEKKQIHEKLRYYYGRFVKAVSEGRGMKPDDVDKIGRGHVWTGAQAKPIGLVDELGGLTDALAYAKKQAGYRDDERVELVYLPRPPSGLLGQIIKLAGGGDDGAGAALAALVGVPALRDVIAGLPWGLVIAPETPQARLPFALVWE